MRTELPLATEIDWGREDIGLGTQVSGVGQVDKGELGPC